MTRIDLSDYFSSKKDWLYKGTGSSGSGSGSSTGSGLDAKRVIPTNPTQEAMVRGSF